MIIICVYGFWKILLETNVVTNVSTYQKYVLGIYIYSLLHSYFVSSIEICQGTNFGRFSCIS